MLLSYHTEGIVEAGCDEAGRGCLAGPVVAAAVILPQNYRHGLLNDSKKLKKSDRDLLRKDIEQDALAWAVAEVDHEEIDRINILNASFLAMHRAIESLPLQPECLLIDGNRFTPYPDIIHHCIIKGDGKYLSIAAASILAKTYRDELMHSMARVYPDYGWESNVGYPTTFHRNAIAAIGVTPYHRRSFRLLPEQLEIF
ncbi:MAG: ribonuclease HII [Cyclobacteriaceae bacterium]